jgi:hypothetical protein
MAENQSAEEVLERYKEILGEEFGILFYTLHNEYTWLVAKWQQFQMLYETNPERIEIMNKTAPFFFRVVQFTIWESIVLQIARLIDPPQSVGKNNLTIKRLPIYIDNEPKKKALELLIEIAESSTSFARDWRNRHIAHRDLNLATNIPVTKLAEANKQITESALKSLSDVLGFIHREYFNTQFLYELGSYLGDAESVLVLLRDGWEADQQRRDRINSGKAIESDYESYRAL